MHCVFREDDANWPKKNIVGKQELEIRVGSDHIAFEVRFSDLIRFLFTPSLVCFLRRLRRLGR